MGRAAGGGAGAGLRLNLRRNGGEAVLRLEGQLDISTAALVDAEIDRLGALLAHPLLLDLHRLDFIDCAGVRPLVRLWSEVDAHCGQLSIAGARRLVALVLATAGLAGAPTQARPEHLAKGERARRAVDSAEEAVEDLAQDPVAVTRRAL